MVENEEATYLSAYPALKEALHEQLSGDQWRQLMDYITNEPSDGPNAEQRRRDWEAIVAVAYYGEAKQGLLARGFTEDQLRHMSVFEVTGRYLVQEFQEMWDQIDAASGLPYEQDWKVLWGLNDLRLRSVVGRPTWRLMSLTSYATLTNLAGIDRQIALRRNVEAIRAYAADHNGKPPATLDDLVDTPAAPDPFTGKPFVYTVSGQTVTLKAPESTGQPRPRPFGQDIQITIVP
jgi:hypothetical protein